MKPYGAAERAKQTAQHMKNTALAKAEKVKTQTKQRVERAKEQAKEVQKKATRLFRINLANTLTLLNALFGFLSILSSITHQYFHAAIFILIGVAFDWLDGKAARRFSEESALGKELDSLSDLVTFGVAPAVLVATISPSFISYAAGGLFLISAAVRLGRFNVQQTKGIYFGVPTTANGIFLPLLIFLGAPQVWFPWYLVLMAFMMNTPFRIKKVF